MVLAHNAQGETARSLGFESIRPTVRVGGRKKSPAAGKQQQIDAVADGGIANVAKNKRIFPVIYWNHPLRLRQRARPP